MGCKSFKKLVRADDQALMNPNLSLLVTNAKTKCMLHLQHTHTHTYCHCFKQGQHIFQNTFQKL